MTSFPRRVSLKRGKHYGVKEFVDLIRVDRVELPVNRDADAVLTSAHAEGSAELDAVCETLFGDEFLKALDYLTRALDMT